MKKNATWKKCNMKRVQNEKGVREKEKKVRDENSRRVARTPQTSKMESFAIIFNGFDNCCKAHHLRCFLGS